MRKNTLVAALAVIVLALFLVVCSDSKITSPTAPVTPNTPSVSISVGYFTPSSGSTLTVGMQGQFTYTRSGGVLGQASMEAAVWVRDDGIVRIDHCSGWNNTGGGTGYVYLELESSNPKGEYAFAKGHTINAVVLAVSGEIFSECYAGVDSNPRSILDRATARKDVPLNWRVE